MIIFPLSAIFLHLCGRVVSFPEVCNPIECFHALDTFFQPSNFEEPCEKIAKLQKCVGLCTPNKTDNFLLEGLKAVKKDLCEAVQDFQLENKCENKHKFRLISCIYKQFHLEAEDQNVNPALLFCRQSSEGEFCDKYSLPLCSGRESYLSEVLLVKLFKPLRFSSCESYNLHDVFELKLKQLAYMKDYNNLAECLDVNSPRVSDCVPKKWISTNVQNEHMLCSDFQSFLNCVEKVVETKCSPEKSVFVSIRQSLFPYLLPHCQTQQADSAPLKSPTTSDIKLNDDYPNSAFASAPILSKNKSGTVIAVNLNEVYSDSSTTTTIPPQNASEVVVLHQHVIITMTYKGKNAANQICVCYFLTALVIIFGIGKNL